MYQPTNQPEWPLTRSLRHCLTDSLASMADRRPPMRCWIYAYWVATLPRSMQVIGCEFGTCMSADAWWSSRSARSTARRLKRAHHACSMPNPRRIARTQSSLHSRTKPKALRYPLLALAASVACWLKPMQLSESLSLSLTVLDLFARIIGR